MMDARELQERLVYAWNPLAEAASATITARWADGTSTAQPVQVPPRGGVRVAFTR
jgi:hypothetical protein